MIKLKNISLDELYWFFKLGKPKNKITTNVLIADINSYIKKPVFFLSTGRCGTKWFSELLSNDKNNAVFHSPKPALDRQSRKAYEIFTIYDFNVSDDCSSLVKEIYLTAREQHLRYTYKTGKRYVETNNYITFFAPVLSEIFPDAKFVHLTRHPLDFIKSGLNRDYYTGVAEDDKRIALQDTAKWESFSQATKIAWLWNETNRFVEEFSEKYNPEMYHFNFNELTVENVNDLLNFLKITIPEATIKKMLPKKLNRQKKKAGNTDVVIKKEEKNFSSIINDRAKKYGYE